MRILLVEDDIHLGEILVRGLFEEGYHVDRAVDGNEAELFYLHRDYSVIILDRMLPDMRGEDLLQKWRQNNCTVPILMLTAMDAVSDRVTGLKAGADDYLCKPFAFAELLARIEVLQRRGSLNITPLLKAGTLELNPQTRLLTYRERSVMLNRLEYELMDVFIRHSGQILSKETLAEQCWQDPWDASDNTIEAQIKNLRKKLRLIDNRAWIKTMRGVGYRLEVE
ncbi:transcriptional regulatory protein CusR [Desulfosporosinus acididurans]|uniref:Stage 0 sporulation protein A homolog n=1 Tax=Desulfosporosinus acididurans TaxID=476652 RepID=A0A0J1FUZ2_9FIRM|nr:response regulator transcription factor [Desulfosporosinus acididurans]KLU66818.1 transcriptional regulatory protein CusR [Desulfosporosinus acididurans]